MTPSLPTALQPYKAVVVSLICLGTTLLLAVHPLKWLGWLILAALVIGLLTQTKSRFARHMLILLGSILLLGLIPINTDISLGHMLLMGSVLVVTVIMPYLLMKHAAKEDVIVFPWRLGRRWNRTELGYLAFAGISAYLVLPFYLYDTGSYLNWTANLETGELIRLFIGTNALGIWDELFFVGVCLAVFRQHLPFFYANIAQAVLWTAFLYELGFRGWGPAAVFVLALSQGYIFKVSKSMLYIITVHLTIDFILFLVLIHLHNPDYLRIFITSPL